MTRSDSPSDALECVHCGTLATRQASVFDDEGQPYCCNGCLTVAEIIREGGWESYYQRREGFSAKPEDTSTKVFDSEAFQAVHVRQVDGGSEVDLQIGGIHCAACTWLVEKVVADLEGVADVHVSYGTGKARIRWDNESLALSDIAQRISQVGYQPQQATATSGLDKDLLARLGVAAFSAMNVMFLALTIYLGWFSGMDEKYATLVRWIALLVATPAVTYGAVPFFQRAWAGLRHGVLQMDVPIAIAITVMYGHGVIATFMGQDAYLDSLTMLIALLLGGRLVEQAGRNRADEAAKAVLAEVPATARRLVDGQIEEVPTVDVEVGDRLVVGVGEAVAVDGVVVDGDAKVDLSLVTGESVPEGVRADDRIPAGAMVVHGYIEVRAEAVGTNTTIASMAQRVQDAHAARAPAQELNDKLAPWFTGLTLSIAGVTLLVWWILQGFVAAIPPTIAVLVVACPCALALATPAAFATGVGATARRGIFVSEPRVLTDVEDITLVAFDKTGTLTSGKPRVVSASDEVIRLATGLERASTHPIARAILDEAAARRLPIAAGESIDEVPGVGVSGVVEGRSVSLRASGPNTIALMDTDRGALIGEIEIRDRMRDDTAEAITALRQLGIEVMMLTGDKTEVAAEIAQWAGEVPFAAELSPDDKADWIGARQAEGHRVLFVGDGLNDAPAIAGADIGVAMRRGSTASVVAADAVVLTEALSPVVSLAQAGRLTRRALRINNRMSITYNFFAVSLAALGWINPLIAAILMPISSFTVILNALSIERRLDHGHHHRAPAALNAAGRRVRDPLREGGA